MRIVFCGSGDFGIPTLRAVVAAGHEVALVVTQPARPAGRGGKPRPPPLAEAATQLGLPVLPVEDINAPENVAAIRQAAPAAVLVVDFGQKIGPEVRAAAPHEAVNLHGSVLPELRGAAPVNWAIIRGYSQTGVTTFRIVERMDAGAIFVVRTTPISPEETAEELRGRLAKLGVEAVLQTLGLFAAGWSNGTAQDESKVTKAPRLKKPDGVINWAADAVAIRNLIHGTWPWPGGQAQYVGPSGKRTPVIIARAGALPQSADEPPGTLGDDLSVSTGQGRLAIVQIKPSGGRLMSWRDFVNGYRVAAGGRFDPPAPPQGG
jgi:methionyl-tRNA formyltransferase